MFFHTGIVVSFCLILSWAVRSLYIRRKLPKGAKWLPGPRGLPLIGRVWDIPRSHPYKRFKQWSDQYGPIYQINVFGVNHIWLASDKVAQDLLVKRGAIYSDRPQIKNVVDSKGRSGVGEYIPLLGHNDVWRRQRRFVHKLMSQSERIAHQNLPFEEVIEFLIDMLDSPLNFTHNTEAYTGRVIARLAFGDVKYTQPISRNSHALLNAISPGANITNIIPQLEYLPAWLSPWKRAERARHAREREFFLNTFDDVKEDVRRGDDEAINFLRSFLESNEKGEERIGEEEGAYIIGMLGLAGLLTTASALMTYLVVCCRFPEWLKRLQEEVDRVCGERMPKVGDSPSLPVLRAVVKEIMRWRPVTPGSIPHEAEQDDIYEGYFIPKGSFIHPSQWAITRDPSLYPSPSSFNPDRWLSPSYPTYRTPLSQYPSIKGFTTFGYGRRYCQGVDLVEAELICGIGGMAWAFDIAKAKKIGGGEQMEVPDHDYTSLLISRPKPFEYSLSARTPAREAALRQEWRGLQEQRKRKMMEKDQRGMTRKRGLDANYATMEKMDGLTTGIREWDGLPN